MDKPVERPWRIGVDVGGTFTDGFVWNESTGAMATAKVLSTPDDLGRAFLATVIRLIEETDAADEGVSYLVHGTTVATNAVLERRLAATALVTTEGFGDLLEIARQVRSDPYDVFASKPDPLVPRHLCFEVAERMSAEGEAIVPLTDGTVAALIKELKKAEVEAVAVCLLHAYRNPLHERRVAEAIRRQLPDLALSLSSELASEFREFPRACTTIVNCGVMPEVSGYLSRLDAELAMRHFSGARLVMQSNGGVSDFAHSAERPVFMIESGPAAGVVGAAHIARELGADNVISFDMGGTTAKVGLVRNGVPRLVHEFEVGLGANQTRSWFTGASGYPILTPAIDLIEIGAGGGSVAWIDDGGKLRVGPLSAGANPGPTCYGLGGEKVTVTDANLVLGRLNPDYFSGGDIPLDAGSALRAVDALADQLELDRVETASGIVQIADAAMSQALRVVSVQRGHDPREFRLVGFGGAGPLHAISLAVETGIRTIIVPPRPGIFSAFGLLVADLKHDFALTHVDRLDGIKPKALEAGYAELLAKGKAILESENVPPDRMAFERTVDIRYVGQSYHLTLPVPDGGLSKKTFDGVRDRFDETHQATYGYAEPTEPCELVTLRLTAVGRIRKPPLGDDGSGGTPASGDAAAAKDRRPVFFAGSGFVDCAVYDRGRLPFGSTIAGPAVIEERDATTLVHPGWQAAVERFGVLVLCDERDR
jgi:N-methylhydantoinase A